MENFTGRALVWIYTDQLREETEKQEMNIVGFNQFGLFAYWDNMLHFIPGHQITEIQYPERREDHVLVQRP